MAGKEKNGKNDLHLYYMFLTFCGQKVLLKHSQGNYGIEIIIATQTLGYREHIWMQSTEQVTRSHCTVMLAVRSQHSIHDWTSAGTATVALQKHTDQLSQLGSHIWIWCWKIILDNQGKQDLHLVLGVCFFLGFWFLFHLIDCQLLLLLGQPEQKEIKVSYTKICLIYSIAAFMQF